LLIVIKMKKEIERIISLPENVKARLELPKIIIEGPLGKVERVFHIKKIELASKENNIIIRCSKATKKEKKMINTIASHIDNMIQGVLKGYEYKLQICSIHFPMTVSIDKQRNLLVIKNFLGETKERTVKIFPGVEISIENDIITVKCLDKELAGQQAAAIERATRITARDRRVFQDGIWIIKKEKGKRK